MTYGVPAGRPRQWAAPFLTPEEPPTMGRTQKRARGWGRRAQTPAHRRGRAAPPPRTQTRRPNGRERQRGRPPRDRGRRVEGKPRTAGAAAGNLDAPPFPRFPRSPRGNIRGWDARTQKGRARQGASCAVRLRAYGPAGGAPIKPPSPPRQICFFCPPLWPLGAIKAKKTNRSCRACTARGKGGPAPLLGAARGGEGGERPANVRMAGGPWFDVHHRAAADALRTSTRARLHRRGGVWPRGVHRLAATPAPGLCASVAAPLLGHRSAPSVHPGSRHGFVTSLSR